MLPGLSKEEFAALWASCKKRSLNRPLSPVEVSGCFLTAIEAGSSKKECGRAVRWKGDDMVGRFIALGKLTKELAHLVDWGRSGSGRIGFSSAVELTMVPAEHQAEFGLAIIKNQLIKREVISVRQLLERSGQELTECIEKVLKRRPVIRYLEIVMGPIDNEGLRQALGVRTQRQRNEMLAGYLEGLSIDTEEVTASLAEDRFALSGGRGFTAVIERRGNTQEEIEAFLKSELGI